LGLAILLRDRGGQLAQSGYPDCWSRHCHLGLSPLLQARLFGGCSIFRNGRVLTSQIHAHRAPDVSAQTQQKIDAAVRQAVDQVLTQEGHPLVTSTRHINFPFGSVVLVVGLWLVAKSEPQTPAEQVTEDTSAPNDEHPSA
jgi:hypothetical protein